MKKSITLKKFGLATVTLFVCLAVMMTCLALSFPSYSAHADTGSLLFSGISVADKCDYGDEFTVDKPEGVNVAVIAPNGVDVTPADATDGKYTVKALQTGSYTVTYYKGDSLEEATASYDFRVFVSLDKEYFLRVDNNGSDIPTYVQKGTTGKKFPAAGVYYYDENKILRSYDDVTITITSSDKNETCTAGGDMDFSTSGKKFYTYTARIGNNGSKHLSQTFTVNVQDTFEDVSRPTLTVSGVSSNISVNRPVTLPKATANDDSDENIKITITVTDPNGKPVRIADVNDDGYGYQNAVGEGYTQEQFDADYPVIAFDNDEAMTFYPMVEGAYVVEYVATDDAGKESAKRQFTMTAGDRVAPVFKNIKDDKIPEKWGLSVKNSTDTDADEISNKLTFTVPEIVDNKSAMWKGEGDTNQNLIDLLFRITDSDNNRVVIEFTDILSKESKNYTKTSSVYAEGAEQTFNSDTPFVFDINSYDRKDSSGNKTSLAGTYTVYFRAGDADGNHSSKTYTIVVDDNFVDSTAPAVENPDVPEYISTTETFTVPAPVASDANDTRLTVDYTIHSGDKSITVKGGEKAEFKTVSGKTYLVLDEDEEQKNWLEIADGKLYFLVKATDDVGNTGYNTSDKTDDYTKSEAVITVIGENATLGTFSGSISVGGSYKTGDRVSAGSFTIVTTEALRKYTGFEIGAYDEKGNPVNVELTTYTVKDDYDNPTQATIHVDGIEILPTTAGTHTLKIRSFNVNGASEVNIYSFEVAASTTGPGGTGSAATISTSGAVNTTYKLKNETINGIGDADKDYCVVRKINSSSVYALMGSEITFKTQGSARIQDGYSEVSGAAIGEFVPYGMNDGKYTVSVTDSVTPVIEVQGIMPTYGEKKDEAAGIDGKVTLPSVVGYNENGVAKITVTVSDGSNTVKTEYDEATNQYSFVGTIDGTYTVTYKAVAANDTSHSESYKIIIGDVKGPQFTRTSGSTTSKVRVNDTFKFDKIELVEGEDSADVKVTKKLYDPTGAEVTSATITGSYSSYAGKQQPDEDNDIVLTMSGTYKVVYIVTDKVGNDTKQQVEITVASKGSGKANTFTGLSIALTVIAVVLLAGVIVYVVRFRKVKSK